MSKITTHLWFDTQAAEASQFYISAFKDAEIKSSATLHNTPSGDADMISMRILDHQFTLTSAGPYFTINPSVSFLVSCATAEEVNALWAVLSPEGSALMELGSYPFSERYGWIQDRYGVSWQLMLAGDRPIIQRITPTMMFVGDVCGKAEEAINFYASVFHNSTVGDIMRYNAGEEPDQEGTVRHASFILEGQGFAAMDSAREHKFAFNEAISFMVHCDTQEEIDYYWEKLSAHPESEQCGWLKDKYGFSWQVTPTIMETMLAEKDEQKTARVTKAFLAMKKFDIATLEKAYNGE